MKKKATPSKKIAITILLVLILLNITFLTWLGWPFILDFLSNKAPDTKDAIATSEYQASKTPTLALTISDISPTPDSILEYTATPVDNNATIEPTEAPTNEPLDPASQQYLDQQGILILSMTDGRYAHLFAYHPQFFPLTRITNNQWDDISPAVSPDGTKIAYASKQTGYWNLFLLDLTTSDIVQLTDTNQYTGAPSWAPDGDWLAYETYIDNNLEIMVLSTKDLSKTPVQLTYDQNADHSPAWSPTARSIAFVSNRDGNNDIWLAQLDNTNNRFINITKEFGGNNQYPNWSHDGQSISFSSNSNGYSNLYMASKENDFSTPQLIGNGDQSIWSPTGDLIASQIIDPNENLLGFYRQTNLTIAFPMMKMEGFIQGMDWKANQLPELLAKFNYPENARIEIAKPWQSIISIAPPPPNGRFGIVFLENITAPFPFLLDPVDESFFALRDQTAYEIGWDFLASLENAFLPITHPSSPGISEDWLNTGRAIYVNPIPLSAGWMTVAREDFGGQTYWRIFLKTRYQDGSQGKPIKQMIWDINSRFSGDPLTFEQGGQQKPAPEGYWLDFTEFANRYGWERSSSLINWRTYYPGTQFNLIILRENLDWKSAMQQVYPSEALMTQTPIPSYTPFPENIPTYTSTPQPTPTP